MKVIEKGLPTNPVPEEKAYSLYEGIEYRDFWEGPNKIKLDQLERAIVRELLPSSGKRIIDVGCGYGRLMECYADNFEEVVFFDGSISLLRQARELNNGQGIYIAGDNNRIPFRDASFDSALMVRVFHHFEDSRACLAEQQRILCHNGRFLFTYHCKRNIRRVLRWLLRHKIENPFSHELAGIGTTLISHHPRYVDDLLADLGFVEPEYRGAGFADKFVSIFGPFWKFAPTGETIAPILGRLKLTPWIFCSARGTNLHALRDSLIIEDLFQCPVCRGDIRRSPDVYTCASCFHSFQIIDGIIDFRIL